MTKAVMSPATRRLLDFLGEVGQRWGLPAIACRVHGYLYLAARPVPEAEFEKALGLGGESLADALAWLTDYRLATHADRSWQTHTDPWELMLRALQERRQREVEPALELLRDCHRDITSDSNQDRVLRLQVGKLLALVEDLAAIDMQTRRLPPRALRQLVGVGGRAARLFDRTFGRKDRE